jgi:GntR family transcriptional repressor for pyruvate dehydrogenase complex
LGEEPLTDQLTLPIKPIRNKRIPEEIVQQLKKLIEAGHIPPGSKLPPERQLAKMLGVSRPSLREALGALDLLGIIELRHGSGTYVSLSPKNWHLEPIRHIFTIKKGTLIKIFEVRKILEAGLAQLAAQRRTEDDLASMEKSLENMRLNLDDPEKYALYELDFHLALAEAADNVVMADLIEKLYAMLKGTRQELSTWLTRSKSFRRRDRLNHKKILDAVRARDEKAAVKAMIDHLKDFVKRHLEPQNDEEAKKSRSPGGKEPSK